MNFRDRSARIRDDPHRALFFGRVASRDTGFRDVGEDRRDRLGHALLQQEVGGTERRIEPYLLDFDGDLYGKRLIVEVWERLRDEAVFASEEELVAQIGRDVDATRAAVRPA